MGFRTTHRVSITRVKPIGIKVVIKNNSEVDGSGFATVTGVQNAAPVYAETMAVTDLVGNGRATYNFPPFTPSVSGDISWTVIVDDGDMALDPGDQDTATTVVVP